MSKQKKTELENENETVSENQDSLSENTEETLDDVFAENDSLRAEIAELKEAVLRQRAETENVRRRGEKERADAGAYAVTGFARDVLGVADNLHRALDAIPEDERKAAKNFIEGVELTERELLSALERHGIQKVNPEVGSKFDPTIHQAMFEVETEDQPGGTICQVVGAGYMIKDRLLRPAMVGVAKNGVKKNVDTKV